VFEIDLPKRYRLQRAPLAQVIVQVRFPLVAHFQELAGVSDIQDGLLELFPYMERQEVQQFAFALGPTAAPPPVAESTVLWRFTADDHWTFVIGPGSAALVVDGADYRGIDDFAKRFSRVLDVLHRTERVRRCDRIGLRYINIVELPSGHQRAWSRWFRGELIGWIGSSVIGADTQLQMSLTQTQLSAKPTGSFADFPADVQALIRHGVLPPGTDIPLDSGIPRHLELESYVIDLDLFIQTPQHFKADQLMGQFTALHTQIDALFRWSLTREGEEHFGLEEL
jgi:uncharacterized protein (TIGR04255 family)